MNIVVQRKVEGCKSTDVLEERKNATFVQKNTMKHSVDVL